MSSHPTWPCGCSASASPSSGIALVIAKAMRWSSGRTGSVSAGSSRPPARAGGCCKPGWITSPRCSGSATPRSLGRAGWPPIRPWRTVASPMCQTTRMRSGTCGGSGRYWGRASGCGALTRWGASRWPTGQSRWDVRRLGRRSRCDWSSMMTPRCGVFVIRRARSCASSRPPSWRGSASWRWRSRAAVPAAGANLVFIMRDNLTRGNTCVAPTTAPLAPENPRERASSRHVSVRLWGTLPVCGGSPTRQRYMLAAKGRSPVL